MTTNRFLSAAILFFLVIEFSSVCALGQQVPSSAARVGIKAPIDESRMITLKGNVHPLARAEFDGGAVPDSLPIRRMVLVLSRSSEQEKDLQQLLEDQQTPGSPRFRKWLTPAQFGEMYGPADADIQTVTSWLGSQGFHVDQVSAGKNFIEFSGNAAEVRQAFHTQMHQYTVGGKIHYANATDPEIPAALSPVVKGIASLNNFDRRPAAHNFGVYHRDLSTGEVTPEYTIPTSNGTYYAIGPADFATIYNTQPLQTASITGTGQTIAVLGISNINLQDVADFRNLFGLGTGNTSVVLDGADPGIVDGAEFEALLDVEWANATAPGASVVLVTSSGSESTGGLELAALHVIESNLASVLSVSYGFCEAALGTTENQFVQTLWQQAAAQGITVVVSSGDSGSAACEDFNTATMATTGTSVSGIASTPYNVAAGGTDFNYTLPASSFWTTTNNPNTLLSARSYIPEMTWNSSCANSATSSNLGVCPPLPDTGTPPDSLNVLAGSGGPSSCSSTVDSGGSQVCQGTPKPSWQTGPGVPQDGVRDVPDISLFSAINSKGKALYVLCAADQLPPGYTSCQKNSGGVYFLGAGGTSVAAPSFAGIVALANQKSGGRLGNLNYLLYSLAAQPGASCTSGTTQAAGCIFHDVVNGNISVPCAAGSPNCSATSGTQTGVLVDKNGAPAYPATAGYDLATGLGSVNGANLVNAIANAVTGFKPSTTSLQLNGATSPITAKHGDPISVTVNVAPTEATGSVSLLGASGGIDLRDLSGGVASWTTRLFPGGNYTAKAHYPGDGMRGASDSNGVSVAISPEDSKTFVNLLTFDLNGSPLLYTASTTEYGLPYILRMDVADSAATVSSDKGVSSNCTNHITSCATGSVSLSANGAPLDGGNFAITADGLAEDFQVQLAPGTYSLAANYAGDASYGPSSGTNSVVITKATTTTSVDVPTTTLEYGHNLSFSANVLSHSNGAPLSTSIDFLFDDQRRPEGGDYGAASSDYRSLQFSTSDNFYMVGTVGTHTLAARFPGDTNYAPSVSDPVTITIVPATTAIDLRSSPNPGVPRSPVLLYAAVSSPNGAYASQGPTGTVTFYDNGVSIGSAPSSVSGNATLSYTFTQIGTHNITASYSGDSNYKATTQSNSLQLTIQDKIPSAVRSLSSFIDPAVVNYPTPLQASFGAPQLNCPPLTGTITFSDNGQPLPGTVTYTTDSVGGYAAALNAIFTNVGTHNLTATYSGDVNYLPVTATISAFNVVAKAQSQVSSTNLDRVGVVQQPLTISAAVYGVPHGPIPSGTVTFLDNGVPLSGTVTTSNSDYVVVASMTYTFTTTGIHNLSAQYSGDSFYTAATGTSIGREVQGLIWMELPTDQGTFSPGGGSTQLNFSLINNTQNDANITLTCTSSSTAATCNVSNAVNAVPAQSRTQVYVDITVPGRTASVQYPANWWIRSTGMLFGAVFVGAGVVDRRRRKVLLLVIAFAFLITLPSCGGGGGSNGRVTPPPPVTPPPTTTPIKYTFTITASDGGANSVSQTYTANVQ